MTYAALSKQVGILYRAARYGWDIEPTYRKWLQERVVDQLTVAGLMADDALDQYRDHLAFDYRLDQVEGQRFRFWWGHVVDKGFDAGNPLANLHRPKVGGQVNPNQAIIRVMPQRVQGGLFGNPMRTESFYDLSNLQWNARNEVIAELEALGYFVQQLWMDDIMPIQVGMEIRRKEAERIAKEKDAK